MNSNPYKNATLSPQTFYILLALSGARARYGYDIKNQVVEDSAGAVVLSVGTLYTALARLLKAKLIDTTYARSVPAPGHERKYYRLTNAGRRELNQERRRLERAVIISRQRLIGPQAWRMTGPGMQ